MELTGHVLADPALPVACSRITAESGRIRTIEPAAPEPGMPFICPGLIDAHLHPMELGLQDLFCDFSGCRSVGEVLALVRARAHAEPECEPLLGFNLEPERLAETRFPTRAELDAVAATPALLYRVDGHSAVLNTPGLKLAFGTATPRGIDTSGTGLPTGVVRGPAYEQASREFKRQLAPATVRAALDRAAGSCLAAGVTTFAALVGNEASGRPECKLLVNALDRLPSRAVPFLQVRSPGLCRELGLDRVGGCLLVDGSFGSHTAALLDDYSDEPGNRGMNYYSDDELISLLSEAEKLGLATAFHAIGDRAVDQLVRCHEQAGTSPRLRHRIEHAELLNADLIRRIARLGLVLCVQPAFEATWGGPDRMYARRLGDRWQNTNPYRNLLDAGVLLAGGSDAPITPVNPLAGIRAAVGHPNSSQRVSGAEALAMFTTAAARSLGVENDRGRIAPGYAADFVLLSGDPRTEPDVTVLATYVAGERRWPA